MFLCIALPFPAIIQANRHSVSSEPIAIALTTTIFNPIQSDAFVQYVSPEQYVAIDAVFQQINSSLQTVQTREESLLIFDNAIEELYELGVFSSDMTLQEIQHVATGRLYSEQMIQRLQTVLYAKELTDENTMMFCLMAGKSNVTIFSNVLSWSIFNVIFRVQELIEEYENILPLYFIRFITHQIGMFCILLNSVSHMIPVSFFSTVGFGVPHWYSDRIFYACGWLSVIGRSGQHQQFSRFMGNLAVRSIFVPFAEFYTGALGFTGIHIQWDAQDGFTIPNPANPSYYLGTALLANIKQVDS